MGHREPIGIRGLLSAPPSAQPQQSRLEHPNMNNFELDVSSSSSSSSSTSQPPRQLDAAAAASSSSDESDHEQVDESILYELRSALHLSVGAICLHEDRIDADSSTDSADSDDMNSNTNDGNSEKPAFTMSKDAIVALTDLTFHYSTTLLANDLAAFSSHAGRRTVKTEDVLLVARKDKDGILAELKRELKERIGGEVNATKTGRGGSNGGTKKKASSATTKSSSVNNNSKSKRSNSKGSKLTNEKSMLSSSFSDSSIDELDKLLREQKRSSSSATAAKTASHKNSNNGSDHGDEGEDLSDFIVNDNNYYNSNDSSSEVEFELDTSSKKKKSKDKHKKESSKRGGQSSGNKSFKSNGKVRSKATTGLSDSSDEDVGRGRGGKFQVEGASEIIAIDLDSD